MSKKYDAYPFVVAVYVFVTATFSLLAPKPNAVLDSEPKSIPNCRSNWGLRGIWPGISTADAGIYQMKQHH